MRKFLKSVKQSQLNAGTGSAAPPTGTGATRHETDDVVRSAEQSSRMADQSRQIKLAAAKKKVKYSSVHLAKCRVDVWSCVSPSGLHCRWVSFILFCFNYEPEEGVVSTRRPTSALPVVPCRLLLCRLQYRGEAGASLRPKRLA